MILIWDNGERYDDHALCLLEVPIPGGYFCEAERLHNLRGVFERLLRRRDQDGFLVGTTDSIAWNGKNGPEHVADYIPPSILFKWKRNPEKFGRDVANVVPRNEAVQLGKLVIGLFHLRWSRSRRGDPELADGDRWTFLKAIDAWVRDTLPPSKREK